MVVVSWQRSFHQSLESASPLHSLFLNILLCICFSVWFFFPFPFSNGMNALQISHAVLEEVRTESFEWRNVPASCIVQFHPLNPWTWDTHAQQKYLTSHVRGVFPYIWLYVLLKSTLSLTWFSVFSHQIGLQWDEINGSNSQKHFPTIWSQPLKYPTFFNIKKKKSHAHLGMCSTRLWGCGSARGFLQKSLWLYWGKSPLSGSQLRHPQAAQGLPSCLPS